MFEKSFPQSARSCLLYTSKAEPTVAEVVPFNGQNENELLRIAACLEEHFPHSMAKAVVDAAKKRKLDHEEMHSKVEYIVAHGISTTIEGKKAIIGSSHFVFEDEKCTIPEGMEEKFKNLPNEYSHLYLAIEGSLAAVICIEDPPVSYTHLDVYKRQDLDW